MRILLISHFFPPEEPPAAFLAFELATALKHANHDVDVITGFPNWPTGTVFNGYYRNKTTIENINGLNIIRLPFLAAPSGSFIRRAIDFTSFQFLVKREGKKLNRPDLIYVLAPPNEDGLAARSLAKHFKCPYVLNIQDIHPDTAINLGYIKNKLLINLLKYQESKMYNDAAHVVTIGSQMKKMLVKKGISEKKISIVPNWIDSNTIHPMSKDNSLREEWEIPSNTFIVLYAGTFGRIHGTSILVDIASSFQDKNQKILFLLVGQGQDFNKIKEKAKQNKLSNILLKPFVPRNRLCELQALADISIVLTKKGFGFTSVPSKVLGYMAAARPVLAAIDKDSDTADIIRNADAGIIVQPENLQEITDAINYIYKNSILLEKWGSNARNYIINQLSPSILLPHYIKLLEKITHQ